MRLDHLLSKEKAKAEMPELNPGRLRICPNRRFGKQIPCASRPRFSAGNGGRTGVWKEGPQEKATKIASQTLKEWVDKVTTALPGRSCQLRSVSHLYRLQGSVRPHLDNCTAKREKDSGKASCRLKAGSESGRQEAGVSPEGQRTIGLRIM